jgi:hypothetical protein
MKNDTRICFLLSYKNINLGVFPSFIKISKKFGFQKLVLIFIVKMKNPHFWGLTGFFISANFAN